MFFNKYIYLGKDLVGIVLDHKHFGNHLDEEKKTIDTEKEIANFKHCGEIVGKIWSESTIDGYPTDAKYVDPSSRLDKEAAFDDYDEVFMDKHCFHGYYSLYFIKCYDFDCCGQWRSNVDDILSCREIPAPRYYIQSKGRLTFGEKHKDPPTNKHYSSFTLIRTLDHGLNHEEKYFDDWNPQFSRQDLQSASCPVCKKYFPTKKLKDKHKRAIHPRSRDNNINNQDIDVINNDEKEQLNDEELSFYAKIIKIRDERDGVYLADMSDGARMWVTLDNNNKFVQEYVKDKENQIDNEAIPEIDKLNEWNNCPWIPDDKNDDIQN